ncbi:hypothetical protein ACS0TY_009128 [Phlomoides rotata]
MEFKLITLQALVISEIFQPSSILGLNNCNFPAIFNLGDSNSDTGGLAAAFGQLPPPFGETFFHAPAGRYSDGRLMIDFMAESLGLPYLSAFLDSVGSNFSHGANFATSGSTIKPLNTDLGYSPFSLDVQRVQYSDFVRRSQIVRQQEVFRDLYPDEDYFTRALYTFDIGQNDLTAGYDLNMTTEEVKALVPDVLDNFSNVIKLLYSQGARSFWIHNTGPVGCLSYLMNAFIETEKRVDQYGCLIPYNEVSQHFNLGLKEMVVQLRSELPEAAITYVDVYSVKYTLISQAKKLGFEDPFQACCGRGGRFNYNRFFRCGSKGIVNGTEVVAESCEDPSVRINWDGIHFTEAASKWIFDRIVDGSFSDPPVPLKFACNRMKN